MSVVKEDAASIFVASADPTSIEEARDLVFCHFGISSLAEPLASERDQNFLVTGEDGGQFILKIAHPAEAPATTDLQTKILLHVAEAAPHLPVQRIVQSNDGAFQLRAALRDGTTRTVRLVTCLQGASLYRVQSFSTQRVAIGNVLAELDLALANFAHESADRTLLWNVSEAMKISDRLVFIADSDTQELARAALKCFNSEALPVLNTLPRQVIHCDFNPHNILVDVDNHERISGILDFGDALMAPRINDVAIAASYHLATGSGSLGAAADLISGYHARSPLSETELDILPLLIGARVAMTVAITSWRAELYPEKRAYILRNTSLAQSGLCTLASISLAEARTVFHTACKGVGHATR